MTLVDDFPRVVFFVLPGIGAGGPAHLSKAVKTCLKGCAKGAEKQTNYAKTVLNGKLFAI